MTLENLGTAALVFPIPGSGNNPSISVANFSLNSTVGTACPLVSSSASSPGTLAANASCTLPISFVPTATGSISGSLVLTDNNLNLGGSTETISLGGTGLAPPPQTATPVISPAAGTYNAPVAVQITDASPSPNIFYTTTGSAATVSSPTYSGVFLVTTSGTEVQAIATATGDVTSNLATPETYTIQPYLSFNSTAVGSSAPTLTAAFSLAGTTAPTAVLHYGHDYSLGNLSCTLNVGIEVCTVPVTFTPTLPGARKDALFLMNGTTQVASVLLGGTGQAPLSLVQPGVVTNPIVNASGYNFGSTVDENGTVYVQNGNLVDSVTKAGVVTKLNITGLNGPEGIAVDGAGILYIGQGDYGSSLVTYNTVTGVQGTLSFVPPSPYVPCSTVEGLYSLVVDDIGDVFALDNLCPQIFEMKPDGTYVVDNINPAMIQPSQLAVDAAGNIFVSGYKINEIPVSGTQTEINTAGASQGLAVDAADTLYATRYSAGGYGVAELPASGYGTPLADLDGGTSGEIESPLGLSLGSDGTLFVGNGGDLDRVDRTRERLPSARRSRMWSVPRR